MGVAKLQEQLATVATSRGQGAGTLSYKAPEMFIATKRSTPVDIFSYGCLLIELYSRKRVREGMSMSEILAVMCGPNPQMHTTPYVQSAQGTTLKTDQQPLWW